jgi:hypothetical protein
VCGLDLKGIVAQRKDSLYRATEKPSPYWVKIKNRSYTQSEGTRRGLRSGPQNRSGAWNGRRRSLKTEQAVPFTARVHELEWLPRAKRRRRAYGYWPSPCLLSATCAV